MIKLAVEEGEELTEVQKMAKAAIDAELEERKRALIAELNALENIDSESMVRRMAEKKEETPTGQ